MGWGGGLWGVDCFPDTKVERASKGADAFALAVCAPTRHVDAVWTRRKQTQLLPLARTWA